MFIATNLFMSEVFIIVTAQFNNLVCKTYEIRVKMKSGNLTGCLNEDKKKINVSMTIAGKSSCLKHCCLKYMHIKI